MRCEFIHRLLCLVTETGSLVKKIFKLGPGNLGGGGGAIFVYE
jgi:hypothetical protein